MRAIYTAPTVAAAEVRFAEFADAWRETYPAMISSWENAWGEFVPFLEFPAELGKIVYTTNAIESLNARFRRAFDIGRSDTTAIYRGLRGRSVAGFARERQ